MAFVNSNSLRRTAPAVAPTFVPLIVGALLGLAAFGVAQMSRAWIGFVLAGLIAMVLVVAARDTERILTTLFVLSLQAGAAYRLFYDKGGSTGLALPFCVLVGAAVVVYWAMAGGRLRDCTWAGRLGLPIAALLGMSVLSLAATTERFVGLSQLLFELELYFIYWMALNLVRSEAECWRVMRLLFATLVLQSVIYYAQSEWAVSFTLEGDVIPQGDLPRPGGTVSTNPAGFASFILPLLFMAVARLMTARGKSVFAYAALITLGLIAIGLTYTRAAWVGCAVGLTWLLLVGIARGQVRLPRVAGLAAAAALLGLLFYPTMAARLDDSPVAAAYDERAGLMRIAMNAIAAHPVLGLGPGAYGQVYKAYLPADLPNQWLYTVHNEYLLRAAETGIPGGIAFIVFLLAAFRQALRLSRAEQDTLRALGLGWSAGLLALAWQMYWVPWRGFDYNALLWFMCGLTEGGLRIAGHPTA